MEDPRRYELLLAKRLRQLGVDLSLSPGQRAMGRFCSVVGRLAGTGIRVRTGPNDVTNLSAPDPGRKFDFEFYFKSDGKYHEFSVEPNQGGYLNCQELVWAPGRSKTPESATVSEVSASEATEWFINGFAPAVVSASGLTWNLVEAEIEPEAPGV